MRAGQKPFEIEYALKVLQALKTCRSIEIDDYDALCKALPIYAAKLVKLGHDVDEMVLWEGAIKGVSFLADEIKRLSAQAAKPRPNLSYESVVAGFYKGEASSHSSAEQKALEQFWEDCREGDLKAVKAYVKATGLATGSKVYRNCMHGMRVAAIHAKLNVFRYLYEQGYGDIHMYQSEALRYAANRGNLAMVKYIYEHTDEQPEFENIAMNWAVGGDHVAVVRYLHQQHGVPFQDGVCDHVLAAVASGALKSLKYMHKNGVDIHADDHEPLLKAAERGHINVVSYIVENGGNSESEKIAAFFKAAAAGHTNVVAYLEEQGVDVLQCDNTALYLALKHGYRDLVDFLESKGASRGDLTAAEKKELYRADKWTEIAYDHDVTNVLWLDNPHYFKPELYAQIRNEMLSHEYLHAHYQEKLAYCASALFCSRDNVLRYLEKWGKKSPSPLYEVIKDLEIPKKGRPDFKAWCDAVMQHGPKMAALVKYADKCPVPLRSACGRLYSFEATRDAIALKHYPMAETHPDMAKFCFKRGWARESFNKAAGLIGQYERYYGVGQPKHGALIPEVTIDGKRFGKEGYYFYKLPDGDPRGLLLGEYTDNCQHIAGAGAACAEYGFMCPSSGFYVVAHQQTDEIIAQSWAWRGKNGEMVFDSLEGLGERMDWLNWQKLIKSLKYQFKKHADIQAFYIGDDGGTPPRALLQLKNLPEKDHAVPAEYEEDAYRDSKEGQLRVFKRRSLCADSVPKFNMYDR